MAEDDLTLASMDDGPCACETRGCHDPTLTDEELARLRFDYESAAGLSLPFATKEAAEQTAAYFEDVAGRAIAALKASREDLRIANEATLVLTERAAKAERELRRLRHGPVGDDAAGGDL